MRTDRNASLSTETIIAAWRDDHVFGLLSEDERKFVPDNPAGLIDLSGVLADGSALLANTVGNCSWECTAGNCTATECTSDDCYATSSEWYAGAIG